MVVVARVYRKYCTYQFTVSRWSLMAADTVSCASSFAISCRAERQCEMGWAGLGWGGGAGPTLPRSASLGIETGRSQLSAVITDTFVSSISSARASAWRFAIVFLFSLRRRSMSTSYVSSSVILCRGGCGWGVGRAGRGGLRGWT